MRVELNSDEIARMLRCEGPYEPIADDLLRRGRLIAESAGDGFEAEGGPGANRYRVTVFTATPEAMRREATDRVLVRALDAGRG
jgi:hypothetical protein